MTTFGLAIIIALSLVVLGLVEIKDGSCCCEGVCGSCDPPIIGDVLLDMTNAPWQTTAVPAQNCTTNECPNLIAEFILPPIQNCIWQDIFTLCETQELGDCIITLRALISTTGGGNAKWTVSVRQEETGCETIGFCHITTVWESAEFPLTECHVSRDLVFVHEIGPGGNCCTPSPTLPIPNLRIDTVTPPP